MKIIIEVSIEAKVVTSEDNKNEIILVPVIDKRYLVQRYLVPRNPRNPRNLYKTLKKLVLRVATDALLHAKPMIVSSP